MMGTVTETVTLPNKQVFVGGVAIGGNSVATATTAASGVALGAGADASGNNSLGLGTAATATGLNSSAVGAGSNTALFNQSTALGYNALCTAANQVMLGTASETVTMPGKGLMSDTALTTTNTLALNYLAGTPTGAAANGSTLVDAVGSRICVRIAGAWRYINTTATGAPAASSWASVLAAGNTTGAFNPTIDNGQSIQYVGGTAIGCNNTAATVGSVTSVSIGGFANIQSVSLGFGASSSSSNGTALGYASNVGHVSSTAVGALATTTDTNQIMLGTASQTVQCPNNLQATNYIRSGKQNACAAGIFPDVPDAPQAISGAGPTVVLIKSVKFDDSPALVSGNNLLMPVLQQVWGVSATMSGNYTGGGGQAFTLRLMWNDGSGGADKQLAAQDQSFSPAIGAFNVTIATAAKSNANPNNFIYCDVICTGALALSVTKFRFSICRAC
jgi:hypothetical protein